MSEEDIIVKLGSDEWVEVINTIEAYCANTVHESYPKLRKTVGVLDMLRDRYQEAFDKKFEK